jgi:hypothetical protein
MPLIKPQAQPGFLSQASQVQAQGAWYRGNRVRWRYGFLEKMGGWERLVQDPFLALIRRMHAWLDLDNLKNLLVGTDFGLELLVQNTHFAMGSQFPLTGAQVPTTGMTSGTTFHANVGSPTVTAHINWAFAAPGQQFRIFLPLSIGGVILPAQAVYTIKALATGGFTFDMPSNALYTEDTYGIRLFLNNIVNGMTCTFRNHGLTPGATFAFAATTTLRLGAPGVWEQISFSAPAGSTSAGVATVIDADHFTFSMAMFGLGDGVGGTVASPVPSHQVFEGSSLLYGTDGSVVTSLPTVLGVAQQITPGNPQVNTWFLGNQGQNGLALSTGGPLWVYNPPIGNAPFVNIVGGGSAPTAPQHSNGMFTTMPQAQVILFGTEAHLGSGIIDPLFVRFSDAGTYDVWQGTVSNQAGSYRLSRGSKIVGGIQAPQTTLLLTDVDLWSMSYIGPPLVYGFTIMGTGCGLLAPHAIVTLDQTTFWISLKAVWSFGSSGIQQIPCSVWDFIFENLDTININKCHGAANSTTSEVAFYFPPKDAVFPAGQNQLLSSEDFTAVWTATSVTAAITGTPLAPDGTGNTTLLKEQDVAGVHEVTQSVQKFGEPEVFTFSVYAHKNSTRNLCLRGDTRSGAAGFVVIFNPTTGAQVGTSTWTPTFHVDSVSAVTDSFATGLGGNGWLRYTVTFHTDDTGNLRLAYALANGSARAYVGADQFAYIWGAQLDEGGQVQPYNRTGASMPNNEPTKYIKYNTMQQAWDSGTLTRTAWIDSSIWGTPLGADENQLVQQHERGFDDDGNPMMDVFIESGFTELGDGSIMTSISQCHPDFKWFGNNGEVVVRLKTKNYPGGPENTFGPFSMTPTTQFFDPRLRARYVAIRYDWSPLLGFSARVGAVTYRAKPTGRRP